MCKSGMLLSALIHSLRHITIIRWAWLGFAVAFFPRTLLITFFIRKLSVGIVELDPLNRSIGQSCCRICAIEFDVKICHYSAVSLNREGVGGRGVDG